MNYTERELALIAVNAAFGMDGAKHRALSFFGDDPVLLIKNYEKLKAPMIKAGKEGLYNSIKAFFDSPSALENELSLLSEHDETAVVFGSEDYPEELYNLSCPPLIIYARGNISLLKKEKFAVVGSRRTPPNILKLTEKFTGELSEYFAVVTGIADGGDSAAITGALKNKSAICVLPCGHGVITPASSSALYNEAVQNGLAISVFRHDEAAKKYSFAERNCIIAQLARGVLVVSAGEKSGTFGTVNEAVSAGKDVFAFPYGIGSVCGVGCNRLIKEGACLCDDVNDILSFYGKGRLEEEDEEPLTSTERRIVSALRESDDGLHIADIAKAAGLELSTLANELTALEIKGKIVRLGGNRYAAV